MLTKCSSLMKRVPYDMNTPLGYLITYVHQFVACYYTCMLTAMDLSFLTGTCWIAHAFLKDLTNELKLFNEPDQFNEIIQLFADAKQLSKFNKNFGIT